MKAATMTRQDAALLLAMELEGLLSRAEELLADLLEVAEGTGQPHTNVTTGLNLWGRDADGFGRQARILLESVFPDPNVHVAPSCEADEA